MECNSARRPRRSPPHPSKGRTEGVTFTGGRGSTGGHEKVHGRGDTMTSSDLPNQPLLRRTPAAAAASPENLVPPHNWNQTLGVIILCPPA